MELNALGQAAMGRGGGTASIDNVPVATNAGGCCWPDVRTMVLQIGAELWAYDTPSGQLTRIAPRGAAVLAARGGIWAAWDGHGVYDALGREFPGADLGDVGPDASLCIKVDRNSFGPFDVIERDGSRWQLTPGQATEIQLLGQGRAIWRDVVGGHVLTRGMPPPLITTPLDRTYQLTLVPVDGVFWCLYYGDGLRFHPMDSPLGYLVGPPGDTWSPRGVQVAAGRVCLKWCVNAGESPGSLRTVWVDLSRPRVDLSVGHEPPPPPPPPPKEPPVIPFDPHAVTFVDNPSDLASWAQTAHITSIDLSTGRICVDHDKRSGPGAWPDAPFGDGSEGRCQYTLGLCLQINGTWYGSAVIQFWQGRELEAGGDVEKIAKDWYYDGRWVPMTGHQPVRGEPVAWFVAAGNLRDSARISVRERSDFVVLPFGENYVSGHEPPPPPPPPPPPLGDLADRLAHVEAALMLLAGKLDTMKSEIHTDLWNEIESAFGHQGGSRKVALRTDNGHYLCAENGGGGDVNATRDAAGGWETFEIIPQ